MRRGSWPLKWTALGVAGAVAIAGLGLWTSLPKQTPAPAGARTSAEIARRIVEARAAWASRTPGGIRRSITDYQALLALAPDNPAVFTGLADAYILSCEFTPRNREAAFLEAGRAARTALALAPSNASANRIAGFLSYWSDRDIERARPSFERALASDPQSALTLLWYGNAMIDAGRIKRGLDLVRQAALLAPDSPSVLTDYAIARWQAGEQAEATSALRTLATRFPDASSAPGALALFSLQSGDLPIYLEQSRRWSELVGDTAQIKRAAREQDAFRSGGRVTLLKSMTDAPVLVGPFWHGGLLSKAIVASLLGEASRPCRWSFRRETLCSCQWAGGTRCGA